MEFLAGLFVQRPLNILAMATFFLAAYFAMRFTRLGNRHRPRPLLVAASAWAAYAAWEWLVLLQTPEANIRIDLLIIWPALAILSAWALFHSFCRDAEPP